MAKQLNGGFQKLSNITCYELIAESYVLYHDKNINEENEEGKKFERKKVRIAEKVELFSSQTFFLQIFFGSYGSRGATTMADHSF